MEQTTGVKLDWVCCILVADVAFAHVPAFFGSTFRNLELSVIRKRPPKEKAPPVVWINGGAWLGLDKDLLLPELVRLADAGFVVATVE